MSDGSAIVLSVANYLTPGGSAFNGTGIAADISAKLTEEQMELLARDQLENTEDAQLQAAVSALVRQGAAVAEIPGTQNAQGTDAIPEEGATQDTSSTSAAVSYTHLSRALEAGEYDATIKISTYSLDTNTQMNGANVKTKLLVG